MGGSDSKPAAAAAQKDDLLELLNQVTTRKVDEFNEDLAKLNKKLENVLLSQKKENGPNASAMLNLKYEKLKLKLRKRKDLNIEETKFVSKLRTIYSEQKEKLRILENDKTIQVANLNLDVAALHVQIDDLKKKVQDEIDLNKNKLQEKVIENCSLTNQIEELKKTGREQQSTILSLSSISKTQLEDYKHQINTSKLREGELQKTLLEINGEIARKNAQLQEHVTKNHYLKAEVADLKEKEREQNLLITKANSFKEEINLQKFREEGLQRRHQTNLDALSQKNTQLEEFVVENVSLKKEILDLKKNEREQNLLISKANSFKEEIILQKLREVDLQRRHQTNLDALSQKNNSNEVTIGTLRQSNVKLGAEQTKFKQEIMFLKTENQKLTVLTANQNDQAKYNDLLANYNLQEQINKQLHKESLALSGILKNIVKLTNLQQRGTFMEIKKSLYGMKTDLQYLIPHLNEKTIPTMFEGNKEMQKLNVLSSRCQENLDNIIAYQSRFDCFVNSKQGMSAMEGMPNFLSGIELPYSFLHIKFLPLFRITFPTLEQHPNQTYPTPLLDFPNPTENRPRANQFKHTQYTPRQQHKDGCGNMTDTTASTGQNRNYRGRGRWMGQTQSNPRSARRSRSNYGRRSNNATARQGAVGTNDSNDDSDCDSTTGVTLTVLTSGDNAREKANTEPVPERTECIICCEALQMLAMPIKVLDTCMHKYHRTCIDEWFESNTTCPQCAMEDY